jgi:glycosyltransferase involved in cell wall biosynthesis
MMYIALPTGSYHGWGVCGKYIVKELSKITDVSLITEGLDINSIGDELDYRLLRSTLISQDLQTRIQSELSVELDGPLLQAINNISGMPNRPNMKSKNNVGYTFFENNILESSYIENSRHFFNTVVTGSSWCENVLREYGITNVTTVIQGIDPTIFNPFHNHKEYFRDSFVVFSGGKFELRKGQDIVIKAYKVIQDRYRDTMLINSWFNQWPLSMNTMGASPLIRFNPTTDDYISMINMLLAENGIDTGRVITLPLYPNIMMPRIYKNTDIGLFPNRCEGGTNLVMMEYMACAKPVLASYNSGHTDVLTDRNCIRVERMKAITIASNDKNIALWAEPDLEETVEKLDWAYHHRDEISEIGQAAGKDFMKMTWEHTGRSFYDILKS